MRNYFGAGEALPPSTLLTFGHLNCLYERGVIRYIKLKELEIVRMINVAVRDRNWLTAPYLIEDEAIHLQPDSFFDYLYGQVSPK